MSPSGTTTFPVANVHVQDERGTAVCGKCGHTIEKGDVDMIGDGVRSCGRCGGLVAVGEIGKKGMAGSEKMRDMSLRWNWSDVNERIRRRFRTRVLPSDETLFGGEGIVQLIACHSECDEDDDFRDDSYCYDDRGEYIGPIYGDDDGSSSSDEDIGSFVRRSAGLMKRVIPADEFDRLTLNFCEDARRVGHTVTDIDAFSTPSSQKTRPKARSLASKSDEAGIVKVFKEGRSYSRDGLLYTMKVADPLALLSDTNVDEGDQWWAQYRKLPNDARCIQMLMKSKMYCEDSRRAGWIIKEIVILMRSEWPESRSVRRQTAQALPPNVNVTKRRRATGAKSQKENMTGNAEEKENVVEESPGIQGRSDKEEQDRVGEASLETPGASEKDEQGKAVEASSGIQGRSDNDHPMDGREKDEQGKAVEASLGIQGRSDNDHPMDGGEKDEVRPATALGEDITSNDTSK